MSAEHKCVESLEELDALLKPFRNAPGFLAADSLARRGGLNAVGALIPDRLRGIAVSDEVMRTLYAQYRAIVGKSAESMKIKGVIPEESSQLATYDSFAEFQRRFPDPIKLGIWLILLRRRFEALEGISSKRVLPPSSRKSWSLNNDGGNIVDLR